VTSGNGPKEDGSEDEADVSMTPKKEKGSMSFHQVLKSITGLDSYEDKKEVVKFAVALENEFGEQLRDSEKGAWGFDEDANVYIPDPAEFERRMRTKKMSRVNVTLDLWRTDIKVSLLEWKVLFFIKHCSISCSQFHVFTVQNNDGQSCDRTTNLPSIRLEPETSVGRKCQDRGIPASYFVDSSFDCSIRQT
jgi:hypothetical protein